VTLAASKRSMAMTAGMPFSVTVPFPNSIGDELSRWHGAFCYFVGSEIPAMNHGWSFKYETSVFMCEAEVRVFSFEES